MKSIQSMQEIREEFCIWELWNTPEDDIYTVYIDGRGQAFTMDDNGNIAGHGIVSRKQDSQLYSATTWGHFLTVCDGVRLQGKHIIGNPLNFA